jgi:hypothetical protein
MQISQFIFIRRLHRFPQIFSFRLKIQTLLNSILVEWLIGQIIQSTKQPINDICIYGFNLRESA